MINDEIVSYLLSKYKDLNKDNTYKLVKYFSDRMMYSLDADGNISGVALYIGISKKAREMLSDGVINSESVDGFNELLQMTGNIFLVFLVAVEDSSLIIRGMNKLMADRKPDGILIMNRKTKRFLYKERKV